jgi:hypothetical protein
VTIYTNAPPESALPRYTSIVGSILLAYAIFGALLGILGHIVSEEATGDPSGATT